MANNEPFEEALVTIQACVVLTRITHDEMHPVNRVSTGASALLEAYTAHEQTLLAAIAVERHAQNVSNKLRSWITAAQMNRHAAHASPLSDITLRYVPSADSIRAALTLLMAEPKYQPCIATLECKNDCQCRVECGCEKCKYQTSASQR